MNYNWQQPDWKSFTYSLRDIEGQLLKFAERIGKISGSVQALPKQAHLDVVITTMVNEAVKTSKIEGEFFKRSDVVSSIRNGLGLNARLERVGDQRAIGISELMLDVHRTYEEPLTVEKLFAWHKMLLKGNKSIETGVWRSHSAPMQVVSGSIGNEKIHFEAPPSKQVPQEMEAFVKWFNNTSSDGPNPIVYSIVRSAIAHLYFESIHPFEDGNGRIGRAISEKIISQNAGTAIPISLSLSIEKNRKEYYKALETAQKNNDLSEWIRYFLSMALQAQAQAAELIGFAIKKARFFEVFQAQLNARQLKVIKKMLEQGPEGFEGGMNARIYIGLTRTSKATATRDLQDLKEKGILLSFRGGRSTNYQVSLDQ